MEKRKQSQARAKPRATTADVVGQARPPSVNDVPHKFRTHYSRLLLLRDQMLRRQTELAKDAVEEQPTFGTHMADAGTDTFDRDLALSLLSSEQDAVYQIEQALDRIRNGTYGICELTGKPIEHDRLVAIPWTRFSADAERSLEKEGRGSNSRRKLSRREDLPREAVSSEDRD